MTTFKKGDVVQLKSGSPPMTIRGTVHRMDNQFICDWFVNDIKNSGSFYSEQLKPFDLTTTDDNDE